ncbi:hypothetical protein [Clostridium sp. UBA2485]|uniref:hypothetical protein n=1 Tax=Clostridium sp. UBA2485 TaxID=1946352 RepID=UPI0025C39D2B|nr:hypothetical protein [Clostridium sp. UBA2485]
MITEVCLIFLSLSVVIGTLAIDVKLKYLERRINCLEDNVLDNMGQIKEDIENLKLQELNTRDIIMEELNSNKEQATKEINDLYSKIVFTPMTFQYQEKKGKQ